MTPNDLLPDNPETYKVIAIVYEMHVFSTPMKP